MAHASEKESLREGKRRETRRRIIETGLKLFVENGYEATTFDMIARAAGISRRTFFSYFKSKDDVLLARERSGFPQALHTAMRSSLRIRRRSMPPGIAFSSWHRAMRRRNPPLSIACCVRQKRCARPGGMEDTGLRPFPAALSAPKLCAAGKRDDERVTLCLNGEMITAGRQASGGSPQAASLA
ncbi:TetR/AcrR family transcriptional regulator [Stakelama sp. CBK3Z-3]|uniref:TetR/AcrR family transcriptional regulator n=1 Tax=Stakelama flava TaxID=2860338 RepID=A0ABS6XNG0_9SPHN|nr:helix-turn-helix domain-containing protein [Stakelama flava]MBW4331752.1 TetR/AcrR family transcriptional regulator [Stakelama flava]